MRSALLAIFLLGITAAFAVGWIRLVDPAATLPASHAALPFSTHLATWIEEGVPIAAVADLDGREYLILVSDGEDGKWSAAVSPGELPQIQPPLAPVALGPNPR